MGYKNISRGLRSLGRFCAGDFEKYADLIPKLPGALELDSETVETAVAKSHEEIRYQEKKAWEEVERLWRERFQPHAVVVPERSVPSPIFVAAFWGAHERMILPLDRTRPRATFIRQALSKMPKGIPGFGRSIGVVVNYTPDRAIRFDLDGRALELLPKAVRPRRASLTLTNGREIPPLK